MLEEGLRDRGREGGREGGGERRREREQKGREGKPRHKQPGALSMSYEK